MSSTKNLPLQHNPENDIAAVEKHSETTNGHGVAEIQSPPAQAEPVNPPPAAPATEQQLQEAESKIEERMSAFERSMLRLTRAGVFVAVLTGLVFGGQLYEMIDAGKQTDKLIQAANKQVDSANKIREASERQAQSAASFATSAEGINRQTDAAVQAFQRTAKASERNAEVAATGARKSAELSELSIRRSQDTFRDEQRAWLGIAIFRVEQFDDKKVKITVQFTNTGKTPAINVYQDARWFISTTSVDGPTPLQIAALKPHRVQSVSPQGQYTLNLWPDVKTFPAEAIKAKTATFYEYGFVQYDDGAGRTHSTDFCLYLMDPATNELAYCTTFNGMD